MPYGMLIAHFAYHASRRTVATGKSRAMQPDHVRLPAEYMRVIELLKRRGEKLRMIEATNEVTLAPQMLSGRVSRVQAV